MRFHLCDWLLKNEGEEEVCEATRRASCLHFYETIFPALLKLPSFEELTFSIFSFNTDDIF